VRLDERKRSVRLAVALLALAPLGVVFRDACAQSPLSPTAISMTPTSWLIHTPAPRPSPLQTPPSLIDLFASRRTPTPTLPFFTPTPSPSPTP
jgi:hypothetical protein